MVFGRFHKRGYRAAALSTICALAMLCALIPAYAGQSPSKRTSLKRTTVSKTTKSKAAPTKSTHRRRSAASAKATGTMHNASSKKSLRRKKKSTRARGQQKIDPERAQAIQEALIREHYLTGEAAGTWNAESEAAMRKYQADNGWQSKTVPDSRALIKLGLGPSKDHLLNPESAMTTIPDPPKAASVPTTSNSPSPIANPATPAPAPASASPDSMPPTSNSTDPQ